MSTFSGKTAVVTGASRGIGRAIAVRLAAGGAKVYCVSTREGGCDDTVSACREAGGDAVALAADVADAEQVDDLAAKVLADGPVQILVNNAGVTRDGLVLRMAIEDFDRVLAVNLRGAFLTAKAFARPLSKAGGARIVNISSVVGIIGNAGQANYAASKAGVHGLTKSLAKEFGGRAVTVNAIAPGFIDTDMTSDLPEAVREGALKSIPVGRFGAPEDIAGVVAFLCSDAGAYVTGQVLAVDGGMTM